MSSRVLNKSEFLDHKKSKVDLNLLPDCFTILKTPIIIHFSHYPIFIKTYSN